MAHDPMAETSTEWRVFWIEREARGFSAGSTMTAKPLWIRDGQTLTGATRRESTGWATHGALPNGRKSRDSSPRSQRSQVVV